MNCTASTRVVSCRLQAFIAFLQATGVAVFESLVITVSTCEAAFFSTSLKPTSTSFGRCLRRYFAVVALIFVLGAAGVTRGNVAGVAELEERVARLEARIKVLLAVLDFSDVDGSDGIFIVAVRLVVSAVNVAQIPLIALGAVSLKTCVSAIDQCFVAACSEHRVGDSLFFVAECLVLRTANVAARDVAAAAELPLLLADVEARVEGALTVAYRRFRAVLDLRVVVAAATGAGVEAGRIRAVLRTPLEHVVARHVAFFALGLATFI